MLIRTFLSLLFIYGIFSSAHAGSVPYTGAWAGSIGDQEIRVCFASLDDSQYYYRKHLRGIRLLAKDATASDDTTPISEWKEILATPQGEQTTGTWQLVKLADGSLSGKWHEPMGSRELKIKLDKVGELENQSCGMEFYRPIEDSASERTKDWNVFLLPKSYKGADRFNAYVRSWLAENSMEDYECQLHYGNNREMELTWEVLTDNLLVVREILFDVYCGGAHNESGMDYQFFDPQTGKKIDPWKWVSGGEKAVSSNSPLRKLIEKLNPVIAENSDCNNGFYLSPPIPRKEGFEFPTKNIWALRGCDSSVVIPYDKLRPYLTATGKAVAASTSGH